MNQIPQSLINFLHASIPSLAAAELLLFLAAHAGEHLTPLQILEGIKPTAITPGAALEYLLSFKAQQIVDGNSENGFAFSPADEETRKAVNDLKVAYNEKPVSLIREIYNSNENKIQSFADSFRFRKE